MKKRIEKVESLFRKKQAYEISIKKKIKTMKQEDRAQALTDYNGVRDDFMINYKIIKGNYKSELNYLNDLEETILSKYKPSRPCVLQDWLRTELLKLDNKLTVQVFFVLFDFQIKYWC